MRSKVAGGTEWFVWLRIWGDEAEMTGLKAEEVEAEVGSTRAVLPLCWSGLES